MKKLILSLIIATLMITNSTAQCTPDPSIPGLIVPPAGSRFDTANGTPYVVLPHGYVGQNYHEVLYFKIPTDTMAFSVKATINHVKLESVVNTPSGMSLTCNPANCKFPGGSSGCASMDGVPQVVDSVEIEIAIEYSVTISGLPTPIKDTLGGYYFVTKGSQPVGLEEVSESKSTPRLYPNPANDRLFIEYQGQAAASAEVTLTNILGRTVATRSFEVMSGSNTFSFDVQSFSPGVYMYSIQENHKTFTGRFTISR